MRVLTIHPPGADLKRLRPPDPNEGEIDCDTEYSPGPWDLIVQWGARRPFDNGALPTANPSHALELVSDPHRTAERLESHQISTRWFEPGLRRARRLKTRYRVHVCDLRVLAVIRIRGRRARRVGGSSNRMRAIREMAVRCAYVLGLHVAAVDVGVIGRKRAVPISINPKPGLTKELGKRYARALLAYCARVTTLRSGGPGHATLGADLEFIMRRRSGGIIFASRYFSRGGRIGYDQQGSRSVRRSHPIVEIRPAPTDSPEELVARIRSLLRRAARRTPKKGVRWVAGSYPAAGYPVGGHIHFSGVSLSTEMLRALDNYVALPVMMLEEPGRARRRRTRYGYLGEFRWQRHGGFEFRTPASWIVAPHFALAVLHLAKLVVEHCHLLTLDLFSSNENCRSFYRHDKEKLREAFEAVWRDLESLKAYREVERHLAIIPRFVRSNREWAEKRDLRERWGIIGRRRRLAKKR